MVSMLFTVLLRAIIRGHYKSKDSMAERISKLYIKQKLPFEEYMYLMDLLDEQEQE